MSNTLENSDNKNAHAVKDRILMLCGQARQLWDESEEKHKLGIHFYNYYSTSQVVLFIAAGSASSILMHPIFGAFFLIAGAYLAGDKSSKSKTYSQQAESAESRACNLESEIRRLMDTLPIQMVVEIQDRVNESFGPRR